MPLISIIVYLTILVIISRMTSRHNSNDAFFRGERRSPWYLVAIGMVGASISGVTFISVPGMVITGQMTYLQTCLGFIVGYFIVAFVLLPVFYHNNLITIYSLLRDRLGHYSYKTGASFFLLSKLTGAGVRFYIVCALLHQYIIPSQVQEVMPSSMYVGIEALVLVIMIWLYTRRSGIRTIVWTDALQTLVMFITVTAIVIIVINQLDMTFGEAMTAVFSDNHSRIFVFDDLQSPQNFWKQFLSGIFIVIVMTGLDQDMMQKNLSCRNLRDAQKDMCAYSFAFVPANLLFMILGVLLLLLANSQGLDVPEKGDALLPMFAATGRLGDTVMSLFAIGIVASAFSSADSALTALTTTFCVDICGKDHDEPLRKKAHIGIAAAFILTVIVVDMIGTNSVINAIYIMCGYTYGPLLGLFAFALLCKRRVTDHLVPFICVASPLLCYALDTCVSVTLDYHFGYELLMLNGILTFTGIFLSSKKV